MDYQDLVKVAHKVPYFDVSFLTQAGDAKRNAQNQLIRWEREGKVWRLKRGVYTLPDHLRNFSLSPSWVANFLYSPSYISLDSALSFYELIPELVPAVTSVALAKTASFENQFGRFLYQSIKHTAFFGFEERPDEHGVLIRFALPEKALLDRIYFDTSWKPTADYIEENLRLQNVKLIRPQKLKEMATLFASPKITQATTLILKLRRET